MSVLPFSDTHGRIPLLLRLVWQWQQEHGVSPDAALIAGDLGVWPDSERLDSTTRKHSQKDPAELAFSYFEPILPGPINIVDPSANVLMRRANRLLEAVLSDRQPIPLPHFLQH